MAPIFHKLLVEQNKIKTPVTILNIGGIANITSINNKFELTKFLRKNLVSNEIIIGMGAGLISQWMRELKNNL